MVVVEILLQVGPGVSGQSHGRGEQIDIHVFGIQLGQLVVDAPGKEICHDGSPAVSGDPNLDRAKLFPAQRVGQVEAELDAEESDYNYSISCALGKIKINDNSMGTFASEKTIQHANARGNIALECGLGNIHVTTRV